MRSFLQTAIICTSLFLSCAAAAQSQEPSAHVADLRGKLGRELNLIAA